MENTLSYPLQSLTMTRRAIIGIAGIVCMTALLANIGAYGVIVGELEQLVTRYTDVPPLENPVVLIAEQRLLTALLINTLVIALIGAVLSGLYMRRLVAPVWRLSEAAKRIAQGNLQTPIQVKTHTVEIGMLVRVLEQSRVNLFRTMTDLAQTRDWLEALVQSITEGIVRFDSEGRITFFSEGAATITGWEAKTAVSQTFATVLSFPASQLPSVGERRSLQIKTKSGRICHVTITRAREIGDGQSTIVLHDISEEVNRRSLQAYFIANMSHEFRTPLSALRISIELLQENWRYLSFSEMDELLTSIYLSTTTLQNLIDNLLESSKVEANYLELRRRPSPLNTILAEAMRVMQPLLHRRQQSLSLVQPLALPPVDVDPVRIVQVIVNLISNASKYSPVGSPIDFIVENSDDELKYRIVIADRGAGIPLEQRETVFQRFVRLNTEYSSQNSSEYGSGLGLSVVKAIIEGHGGQVGVEAREGSGSKFWFTLPISKGQAVL